MKKPINENYAALIAKIDNIIPIEKADRIQSAIILGNSVIVDKSVQIGDIVVYFPVECQLSESYLSNNNLYSHAELNVDKTKTGKFKDNGRVKCIKLRETKSEGLAMPLSSFDYISPNIKFNIGDSFDELEGQNICKKYVIKERKTNSLGNRNKGKKGKISKLVENQFRFHDDTSQLFRNLHRIKKNSLIQASYKIHGTSSISSKILCKKHLNPLEKVLKFLRVKITDTEYDYIYSSRTVIKNDDSKNYNHFYNIDVWGIADSILRPYLQNGMTFYYEIAGFLPNGGYIQKGYDYGCIPPENGEYIEGKNYKIFIYRITYTNISGKVFEFSARQVQEFCNKNGLRPVPELYYGYAWRMCTPELNERTSDKDFPELFLKEVKEKYNDKDCYICSNLVPEEGCVIRLENNLDFEAYKVKSFRFLEKETNSLNSNESNIEDEN